MTAPTSPLAYLQSLISGLLPAGEGVADEEIQAAPGVFVLTARPRSARGPGVLLGEQRRHARAIHGLQKPGRSGMLQASTPRVSQRMRALTRYQASRTRAHECASVTTATGRSRLRCRCWRLCQVPPTRPRGEIVSRCC